MRACIWGAVALHGILFGINRVTGRNPLPQMNFVLGFRLEFRPVSGCSFRGLGIVPAVRLFFLWGSCSFYLAGPCDGAGNCKVVDLRVILLSIERFSSLDSGFSGRLSLVLLG